MPVAQRADRLQMAWGRLWTRPLRQSQSWPEQGSRRATIASPQSDQPPRARRARAHSASLPSERETSIITAATSPGYASKIALSSSNRSEQRAGMPAATAAERRGAA